MFIWTTYYLNRHIQLSRFPGTLTFPQTSKRVFLILLLVYHFGIADATITWETMIHTNCSVCWGKSIICILILIQFTFYKNYCVCVSSQFEAQNLLSYNFLHLDFYSSFTIRKWTVKYWNYLPFHTKIRSFIRYHINKAEIWNWDLNADNIHKKDKKYDSITKSYERKKVDNFFINTLITLPSIEMPSNSQNHQVGEKCGVWYEKDRNGAFWNRP